jgi:glycosyltransferase involved in cell wall biosynthesis
LPALVAKIPELVYLIVGGDSPEGNIRERLESQVKMLKLENNVRFLGAYPSRQLKVPLSAADLFVLATANEGWANVFLEAMACGLPVITTAVGGNKEVVNDSSLGTVVPFGDSEALLAALLQGFETVWDRPLIMQYAQENSWESRVKILVEEFQQIALEKYA